MSVSQNEDVPFAALYSSKHVPTLQLHCILNIINRLFFFVHWRFVVDLVEYDIVPVKVLPLHVCEELC